MIHKCYVFIAALEQIMDRLKVGMADIFPDFKK